MPVTAFTAMLIQTAQSSACSALVQRAAATAVTAVWQGAVIASGLAICLRLSPRTSAEHRFAIWTAAFTTLISLPFVTFIANIPADLRSGASFANQTSAAKPLIDIDTRWSLLIAALWAAATLFRAIDLVIHSLRLCKLWRDAVPVDLESNLSAMLAATKATDKRGPFEVCTTTTQQRPSVIGFFRPRILIPDWLFARLTPGELEQIVLHEAEHLRRYDDWTNLFQKVCLVLFPLNPALLFIEHRLCREREIACDDGVIKVTHAPRAYAACLTSLAERGLQRRAEALSLGAWQRRPELVHRVHSILRRKRTLGPLGTSAVLGALGCGLLFGSIELARCPQLIAFVSYRDQSRAPGSEKLAVQASPQHPSARLLNASCILPRGAVASNPSPEPRETKMSATLTPQANCPPQSECAQATQLTVAKEGQAVVSKMPTHRPGQRSPRAVSLKTGMSHTQAAPAKQQWVVLTTWEQIQTSNQNAGQAPNGMTSDYETGSKEEAIASPNAASSPGATTDGSVQPKSLRASQTTVTRLIFKFFPVDSSATQPAFVSLRNGWFVIQL